MCFLDSKFFLGEIGRNINAISMGLLQRPCQERKQIRKSLMLSL